VAARKLNRAARGRGKGASSRTPRPPRGLVALLRSRVSARRTIPRVRGGFAGRRSAPRLTVYTTEAPRNSSFGRRVALARLRPGNNLRLVGLSTRFSRYAHAPRTDWPRPLEEDIKGRAAGPARRPWSASAPPGTHCLGPSGSEIVPLAPAVRDVGAHPTRPWPGSALAACRRWRLASRRRRKAAELAELEPAQVAGHPGGTASLLYGRGPGPS